MKMRSMAAILALDLAVAVQPNGDILTVFLAFNTFIRKRRFGGSGYPIALPSTIAQLSGDSILAFNAAGNAAQFVPAYLAQ